MTARAVGLACTALAGGVLLGVLAWGEGRVPVLALVLPLAVVVCRSRIQAFLVGAGYLIGMMRYTPEHVGTWFDHSLLIGGAVVAAAAAISGAVWAMAKSGSSNPYRRAAAMFGAWFLGLVPPAALGFAGHPLVAVGYVLPGFGWLGVFLAPVLAACAAAFVPAWRRRDQALALALSAGIAALGGMLGVPNASDMAGTNDVRAVSTEWGGFGPGDDAISRIERIGRAPAPDRGAVVIWPESIVGRYEPALYPVLDIEVLEPARRAGRTVVIGMDIPTPGERLLNAAVAFYPDGSAATAVARQPAPISLWRPWRSTDTFIADWAANNVLSFGEGERVAILFCYEEFVPILFLLNELKDRPTAYVVMSNTWAAPKVTSSAIQTWHSLGMARLFARPYIKAENRPQPRAPSGDWTPSFAP